MKEDLWDYANLLYGKAVEEMNAGRFGMADIYAASSYGVSAFLSSNKNVQKKLRDEADSHKDLDELRGEVRRLARSVGRNRK